MKKEIIKLLELNGYRFNLFNDDVMLIERENNTFYVNIDDDYVGLSTNTDSVNIEFHFFTLPLGKEFESIKQILQIFKFI